MESQFTLPNEANKKNIGQLKYLVKKGVVEGGPESTVLQFH